MYKDRHFTWLILIGALAYAGFLIWLAFNCFWAFLAIIVLTICGFAYGIKHAELVALDDTKYDKKNSLT